MTQIKSQEIQELLTIIPRGYPCMDIYYLTSYDIGFCEELYTLCKENDYEYELMISNQKYFDKLSQTTELKPHKFEFDKSRYNRHSKMYDFVFVSIDLEKVENQKMFFKKLYAVSKNAGKVIFITSLEEDLQTLEEKLIEYNYVAVNSIASTFSNYQILSAQKMHGWGN
jgi:hypothetical protein